MQKGQVFIFVFLFLLIVSIMVSGLFSIWQAERRISEGDRLIALYAAQAGIERAKIQLENDWNNTTNCTNQSIGIAKYSYNITIIGSQKKVVSDGRYESKDAKAKSERKLEINITNTTWSTDSWREN
jgi:Tfp pilus assembly protein PilX